jgi:hypothetical protein
VSQSGVQFVQFPTPKYTQNGFYATIQGALRCFIVRLV